MQISVMEPDACVNMTYKYLIAMHVTHGLHGSSSVLLTQEKYKMNIKLEIQKPSCFVGRCDVCYSNE